MPARQVLYRLSHSANGVLKQSHRVAQFGLKLETLLPLSPECWVDDSCTLLT
jgi:hypothetical protein